MSEYKTISEICKETGFTREYVYILTRKRYFEKKYLKTENGSMRPVLRIIKMPFPRNYPPVIKGWISQVEAKKQGIDTKAMESKKVGRYIYFKTN